MNELGYKILNTAEFWLEQGWSTIADLDEVTK